MKNLLLGFLLVFFISSCNENRIEGPVFVDLPFTFEDDFESQNNSLDDLFPEDVSRWTNMQQQNPTSGENTLSLNDSIVLKGNHSIQVFAKASDDILSKMDIEKGNIFAPEGSSISIEASFYIASDDNDLNDLLLIDAECCTCWDPTVDNNQCPGVRLMLGGTDNYLSIERGKIGESTISQSSFSFPRNEWVNVVWNMTLSSTSVASENVLLINGIEVINESGNNLPNPNTFRDIFAAEGIDFELQEPLGIERVQIGATANPTENDVLMYIDDFILRIE